MIILTYHKWILIMNLLNSEKMIGKIMKQKRKYMKKREFGQKILNKIFISSIKILKILAKIYCIYFNLKL